MKKWKRDAVVCLVLLIFYAVMFTQSVSLKAVARTYPQVLLAICAVLTAVQLAKSIAEGRRGAAEQASERERKIGALAARDIVLVCVGLIVYTELIPILGYITSTMLFTAGTLLFLRIRRWYVVIGVSVGTAVFLHYMFNTLLGILLPAGFLI